MVKEKHKEDHIAVCEGSEHRKKKVGNGYSCVSCSMLKIAGRITKKRRRRKARRIQSQRKKKKPRRKKKKKKMNGRSGTEPAMVPEEIRGKGGNRNE